MFQFNASVLKSKGNVYGTYVLVPETVSEAILKNGNKRLVVTYNSSLTKHCALLSQGNGIYILYITKDELKKIAAELNEQINVTVDYDNSEFGMPMSEEMSVLFEQDDEGKHYFDKLTPGKKRSLIHLIGKPKNSDIRISKAIAVVNYLKEVKGKLDFKELNEALKKKNRI